MEHPDPARKLSANLYDIYLMLYVQFQTPDDGRKDRLKHVECCSKIKYIRDIVHLAGFTILVEIHYDARSYKYIMMHGPTNVNIECYLLTFHQSSKKLLKLFYNKKRRVSTWKDHYKDVPSL